MGKEINELSYSDLLEKLEKLNLIFDASKEGMWFMDTDNVVEFFNKNFYRKFDISLVGSTLEEWQELIHPGDKQKFGENVEVHIGQKLDFFKSQYRVIDKTGKYVWIEALGKNIYDNDGILKYMVGSHVDITDRVENEKKISELAYIDETTKLFNLNYLKSEYDTRFKKSECTYFYVDINSFKNINDLYGHNFGDQVIKRIADRLLEFVGNKYRLFRLRNDEFLLVFKKPIDDLVGEIENIRNFSQRTIWINGTELKVDLNIGILNGKDQSFEEVFDKLSVLMNHTKKTHDKISYYDDKTQKSIIRELSIIEQLKYAITNKMEFYPVFQPIVSLENGSIDSFELLMRWKSNILGDVSPGEFIPAAESNDLIIPIGYMAIEMACDFIKLFNGRFKISVNISTIQLKDLSFTAKMLDILNTKGVSPSNFILEITESSVLSTDQSTKGILEKWDNLGMTLAMDDFGTGYSSLGNMLTFSFKKIKVDKSLIDHLDEKMPQNLIKSIVNFAKSINISVVAEGVEDNKTLELVKSAGFCYLQGYFESKPLVIDDLIEYVKRKDK